MKSIKSYTAVGEDETRAIAAELAEIFKPNDVVLLEGNLGSGKTFLVKELCRRWNTEDEASSPTFALWNQYGGQQPVNHFDLYRIRQEQELDNLGWEEALEMDAVTFFEWPDLIEAHLDRFYKLKIEIRNGRRHFHLLYYEA